MTSNDLTPAEIVVLKATCQYFLDMTEHVDRPEALFTRVKVRGVLIRLDEIGLSK